MLKDGDLETLRGLIQSMNHDGCSYAEDSPQACEACAFGRRITDVVINGNTYKKTRAKISEDAVAIELMVKNIVAEQQRLRAIHDNCSCGAPKGFCALHDAFGEMK